MCQRKTTQVNPQAREIENFHEAKLILLDLMEKASHENYAVIYKLALMALICETVGHDNALKAFDKIIVDRKFK